MGVRCLTSVAGHSSCPAILSRSAGTQHTKSRKHRKYDSYKQEGSKGDSIAYDQFLSTRRYHERERETDEKQNLLFCAFFFLAYHSTPNSLFLIIFPFLPSLGLFSGLSCSTQRHIACYSPSSLHPSLDLTFTAWSQHSSPACPPIPTARQSARLPLKLTPHHHSTMPHPLTTARACMPSSQLG